MSICYVSFKKIEKLIRYTHRFNFINQTKCVGLLRPFNVIRSADFTLPMQLSTEVLGHICLETLFNKKSYHTETSQLIFDANQFTRFYMIRAFTERYFRTDYQFLYSSVLQRPKGIGSCFTHYQKIR